MVLERVTITGADDSIKPWKLIKLSRERPQVEWGLLISAGRNRRFEHAPRWPSISWLSEYFEVQRDYKMHTSLHLCGDTLRALLLGDEGWLGSINLFLPFVERVQLNFHGDQNIKCDAQKFIQQLRRPSLAHIEWIFQVEGVNDNLYHLAVHEGVKAVPLFDMSHGAGVLPDSWPEPIAPRNGYAGGLGPGNIHDQCTKLITLDRSGARVSWIDMETKVRSQDDVVFDLDKVAQCLKESYIHCLT